MEEIRRKQDEEDEISGKLVFVKGDGDIRQIKGGTVEKLVERLTDGVTYGLSSFSFILVANSSSSSSCLQQSEIFFILFYFFKRWLTKQTVSSSKLSC